MSYVLIIVAMSYANFLKGSTSNFDGKDTKFLNNFQGEVAKNDETTKRTRNNLAISMINCTFAG